MTTAGAFTTWHELPVEGIRLRYQGRSFLLRAVVASELKLDAGQHHFGFVVSGAVALKSASGEFSLRARMYFSLPGAGHLRAMGQVLVVSQTDYRGVFLIGGPAERTGRLRYIDGCSDSLLIPPVLQGDACLNLLCIPPGVDQTAHTHPSFRVGVVIDGLGICRTGDGDHRLEPGSMFQIHADGLHSFHTADRGLSVIAFHPDSDCGPTHDDHPMLNRTFVDGVPINNSHADGLPLKLAHEMPKLRQ